jgi:F-type H+-transporting ATPase subunit c
MDFKWALSLALPLGLGIVGFGSALGLGKAVSSAMDATARQPEASGKIMTSMIVGCAFIEALTIYALVFSMMISGKL